MGVLSRAMRSTQCRVLEATERQLGCAAPGRRGCGSPCLRKGQARPVWPHMLRHSRGYYLFDKGTDLGTMQNYIGPAIPSTPPIAPVLWGIVSRGSGDKPRQGCSNRARQRRSAGFMSGILATGRPHR
jgi:hypothetical protein